MSAKTANQTHFVDAEGSASRYGFSKPHWLRLVDAGKAPAPTRFGRLVRWSVAALEEWEQGGCKPVRIVKAKGGAAW
jgi:predicted DNA-binding transcriptional regulator AlpA